jgi:hypothetical protein
MPGVASLLLSMVAFANATYADPTGAFACDVPQGWQTERVELGEGLAMTEIGPQTEELAASLTVFVQNSPTDIELSQHGAIFQAFLDFLIQALSAEGSVRQGQKVDLKFDGRAAKRLELSFTDEDGKTAVGRVTVVVGKRNALAVVASWPKGDKSGEQKAIAVEGSLAVESRSARKGGGGVFSPDLIAGAAKQMKGNFKRSSMTTVLSPGEPPLTYGSVANFVTVIEILFDIQFTEAEFLATQQRFIEFYGKADAEGKRILAEQGAGLLKTLTTGTKDEREASRAEGKAVFENAFRQGSEMGIGYAQVMWDAISRRSNELGQVKARPKKEDWDQQISEGDIDATMELLIFMWVGAGRPVEMVTQENVLEIRAAIIQSLPQFDPQLQLMIANAPKIYAGLRQQWASSNGAQRLTMSQQFEAALTEWGIGSQGFEQTEGGGGGGGENSMNAQIAMNTAWNSAKTWTTTSGG